MGGKASREKGKRGERATAIELASVFGEAKRGLSQSRGGAEVPDVELPKAVPLWVEVKTGKRTNPRAALAQASLASMERSIDQGSLDSLWMPLAICREDRQNAIAAMFWEDFASILREWWQLKQQAGKEAGK